MQDLHARTRVTLHLQVRGPAGRRKYLACWTDRDGVHRTRTLGAAHVKDSESRTARGAVIWRAANRPAPAGGLTPKMAVDALAAILDEARNAPRHSRAALAPANVAVPTFGDAVVGWLTYIEVEKRRKPATLADARNVAKANLVPQLYARVAAAADDEIRVVEHPVIQRQRRDGDEGDHDEDARDSRDPS
jgi:hypothetical protein